MAFFWASAHTKASAHPPILTVLWFFTVLHVTAYHVKFSRSESEGRSLRSHSYGCSDALWAPQLQASKISSHPSVASFAVSSPAARNLHTASDD